jgi:hypothetical protein
MQLGFAGAVLLSTQAKSEVPELVRGFLGVAKTEKDVLPTTVFTVCSHVSGTPTTQAPLLNRHP